MPPKKKEEEIDISTLPPCTSINIFLYIQGKTERANHILNTIHNKNKNIIHINKNSILEFAKEKNIYIDPNTLTDKQKKDTKFMDTICTELTPAVFAKAVDTYINHLNVKIRVEKKNELAKPEEEREKDKKIDVIYIFDDLPNELSHFESFASVNQGIKFVFVFDPVVSWENAPEEPEPAEPAEDGEEENQEEPDEEWEQFLKLKAGENYSEEDQTRQNEISEKINKLKELRRLSNKNSTFRNTVIEYIKCKIDPYSEDKSIENISNLLLPKCEQLLQEEEEFYIWKKDKQTLPIEQQQNIPEFTEKKEEESKEEGKIEQEIPVAEIKENKDIEQYQIDDKSRKQMGGDSVYMVLNDILAKFDTNHVTESHMNEEIDFSQFEFNEIEQKESVEIVKEENSSPEFIEYNQKITKNERQFEESLLENMKYPGINRFSMPEIATKSEGLRKLYRSSFGQFLPPKMTFEDFERKMRILFLESCAKEADEDRTYDFSDRVFEEQHTKESLRRELHRALLFNEASMNLKYDENGDKLYMALVYRDPPRHMSRKNWENAWKVLPNLESWLKYFKENELNLLNNQFYDIDYEKIGHVQEESKVFAVNKGNIVRKKYTIGGVENKLLYCLAGENTGELVFGVRSANDKYEFYAENEVCKINIRESISEKENRNIKVTYLTFKDGSIFELHESGDILSRKPNCAPRRVTPQCYTIIHNKPAIILHPNSSVTVSGVSYTNEKGLGLCNKSLHGTETLRKLTESGKLITRRDDNTVSLEEEGYKWIKFDDGSECLHQEEEIIVEKEGMPVVRGKKDGSVIVDYNGVQVHGVYGQNGYEFVIEFERVSTNNSSKIIVSSQGIKIDSESEFPYELDLSAGSITKKNNSGFLSVSFDSSKLIVDGKEVHAEEEEENEREDELIGESNGEVRIFVINNDNSGVELLTREKVDRYFNGIKERGEGDYRSEIRDMTEEEKKIILGITPVKVELNEKQIPNFSIKTDVFNNIDTSNEKQTKKPVLQLRHFVEQHELTKEDREEISEIIKKRIEWQNKSEKEDNEFGNRSRNHPSTLERYEEKKNVILFRKLKEKNIVTETVKNKAIELYQTETQLRHQIEEEQAEQEETKKRLSKKKSYVSEYLWKKPDHVESDENSQFYNPKGEFYQNYFETVEGRVALSEMPEWIFRPKVEKKQHELDPEIRSELLNRTRKEEELMNNTNQKNNFNESERNEQKNYTVEDRLDQPKQVYMKPSVFTKREIDEEKSAFENEKKAYEYHEKKRKNFNLYGDERKNKPEVPSLMRTLPVSELNQKYLVTEAPVDKKVKISSMKNKLSSSSSNMTEMRKEGPHANLIRTLDKSNDYGKLLERRTMMVQADLNDKLQRDILIYPVEACFGTIREGSNYEVKIEIKNEDVLSQRVQLKKPKSVFCSVQMTEMGPIALGMTRKIKVVLKASPEIIGKFTDEFDIVTKHEIYHIPITAYILEKNQFEASGSILLKTVREFEEIGRKNRDELPPIK